jgi:hypothetical protein
VKARGAIWACTYCGGLNLPGGDCLWCYGQRKLQALGLRILADMLDSVGHGPDR